MKTLNLFAIIAGALILGSCTTAQMATAPYDDAYYSPKIAAKPSSQATAGVSQPSQQGQTKYYNKTQVPDSREVVDTRNFTEARQQYSQPAVDTNSLTEPDRQVSTENFTDSEEMNYDEYYDYAYAVRIKRFHTPVYGVSYYDPYYTDMYYYNYDPFYCGSSIYFGLNWGMGPSWGFNWGFGWGYPGYNSMFSNWYSPFYWGSPYSYGYGSYGMGYNSGYWNGYYDGGGYYGSHWGDENSYYGRRTSRGSTNGAGSGKRPIDSDNDGISNRRIAAGGNTSGTNAAVVNPQAGSSGLGGANASSINQRRIAASDKKTTSGSEPTNATARPIQDPNASRIKAATGTTGTVSESGSNLDSRSQTAQQRYSSNSSNARRYDYNRYSRNSTASRQELAKPRLNATPANTGRERVYTPPSYSQPRSSNNYNAPRNQNRGVQRTESGDVRQNTNSRQYNVPQQQSSTKTYSQPTRSNNSNYTAPAPTRSSSSNSGTYSAPARTGNSGGGSYTPSRSSGGSSSGGSTGGGGRRR